MIERAKLCHSLINQDSISFPYECMIAEIIIQTYWNICEKEKNQYNISPDNGNDPTSEIGKYIGEYFKKLKQQGRMPLCGEGIIAFVLKIILKYQFEVLTANDNLNLANKLTNFYEKYLSYFRLIKMV